MRTQTAKNVTGAGTMLPGLAEETISMTQAARLLDCRHHPRALARFGLKPVGNLCTGKMTFRVYDRAAVLAAVETLRAREADRNRAVSAVVERTLKETGLTPPAADGPSGRQVLAILCEIRDATRELCKTLKAGGAA